MQLLRTEDASELQMCGVKTVGRLSEQTQIDSMRTSLSGHTLDFESGGSRMIFF